ncbi:tape measure protein [Enterobacter hormaechei]|uniref:Tape measure protein n=1 Tax=Enterobacter hormaechei TaxID=158836 RepID=A0A4Y5ZW48_9ENTR|nr:tape measure protein [Enterobacter hormaechei]
MFEGVSQYGTVLGATGEEQSRALLALNQMYAKGTVQAEELKVSSGTLYQTQSGSSSRH